MKAKRFNKKLHLNKKTVANLNHNEMTVVYGGKDAPPEPEPSIELYSCEPGCTDGCCTQGTSAGGFCC